MQSGDAPLLRTYEQLSQQPSLHALIDRLARSVSLDSLATVSYLLSEYVMEVVLLKNAVGRNIVPTVIHYVTSNFMTTIIQPSENANQI